MIVRQIGSEMDELRCGHDARTFYITKKALDRRAARQTPDLDEHLHLALRQPALGVGEGELHARVARGDQKRLAVAAVGLDEHVRDLVHIALAVGERLAERRKQGAVQRGILPDQALACRHHVLDHLVEAGQRPPGVAVGVETRHVGGLFAVVEELVEQHHRVRLAAAQHADQRFLRARRPFQRRGVDAIGFLQKVLMNGVAALMGRDQPPFELARPLDLALPHEQAIALAGRLPLRAEADDGRAVEPPLEEVREIDVRDVDLAADQDVLELAAGRIRHLNHRELDAVRLHQSGA